MLEFFAQMSSTELNKTSGKVLDLAIEGPVRVIRRNQHFVIIREETLDNMLEAAKENRPRTLQDMLVGYDSEKIKSLVGGFISDEPAGKEIL
ncbi:MAG: hypothetical protein WCF85_05200 [Rhodospirillaceae bacterium]